MPSIIYIGRCITVYKKHNGEDRKLIHHKHCSQDGCQKGIFS